MFTKQNQNPNQNPHPPGAPSDANSVAKEKLNHSDYEKRNNRVSNVIM